MASVPARMWNHSVFVTNKTAAMSRVANHLPPIFRRFGAEANFRPREDDSATASAPNRPAHTSSMDRYSNTRGRSMVVEHGGRRGRPQAESERTNGRWLRSSLSSAAN